MRTLRPIAPVAALLVAIALVPTSTGAKTTTVKAGRYQSTYTGRTQQGLPVKIVTTVELIKDGKDLIVGSTPKVTAATKLTLHCDATEFHGAVDRTVSLTGNPSGLMLTTAPEGADLNGSLNAGPEVVSPDRVAAAIDGRVKFKNRLPYAKSVMRGSVNGGGTFKESGSDTCLGGGPNGSRYTAKWTGTKRVR